MSRQLFDLGVKGQGQMNGMMVRYTPSNGHAPTYQISKNIFKNAGKNEACWCVLHLHILSCLHLPKQKHVGFIKYFPIDACFLPGLHKPQYIQAIKLTAEELN